MIKKIFSVGVATIFTLFALPSLTGCKKGADGYAMYEITAEYVPETRAITGAMKFTFENPTDEELVKLSFQLYPNAYRKDALYKPVSTAYESVAYYKGESYGEMSIYSVHGSKNWEIMGEDENILNVYLEKSLFPGEKVVLDIGFRTQLAEVAHRTGMTKYTINLGNFYPILCGIKNGGFVETVYYSDGDPFYSECADYKVTLTIPKEYVVASTGTFAEEKMLESKKEYTMSALNVRDFAMVLSEDFRVERLQTGNTTLAYYYYADQTPKKTLSAIAECFHFYEEKFGRYPYSQYAVAQTGFCLGGMEYPCLTFLSDELDGNEKIRAIAHETAHQWWYAVVGNNQIENGWQDEGLAEYSALTFFEKYEKYDISREGLVKEAMEGYRSYYDVYGSVLGRTDTRMTRHLKEYLSDYEYKCLNYDKAVIMFDTLRKSVGDDKFFEALRRYYKLCAYKQATAGDLIGSFEKSGLDVNGFFDSFLSGKVIL